MDKYTTYVGMDVHARSVTATALVKDTGETVKRRFGRGYSAAEIASWCSSLAQPVYLAYESGCTGVWLARELRALGVDCDVIAVSTLARSAKDRQEKCDKLDSRAILREMANPLSSYSRVWIPTEEQEGAKEICRAYECARSARKRAKQNLSSFLLRHGRVWNETTSSGKPRKPSGRAYDDWVASITFSDKATQQAYLTYVRRLRAAEQELKEMRALMEELMGSPENAPYVAALREVKGIDSLSAMVVRAEIGDFERFASGRKLSSWLGTTSRNSSSGEKERHGAITKAGSKYVRRTLIEGICAISAWNPSAAKQGAGAGDLPTSHIARACNIRMVERYRHLVKDGGKNTNKAKVACANELIRWLWVIGREVQRGLAARGA